MTPSRNALLLTLALVASPALASNDVSKVNGTVTADAGQTYGDLETVNGSVHIGAGAHVEDASTVNGGIDVADNAVLDSLTTVNGGIKAGNNVRISGGVEAVNGSIFLDRGTQVQRDVSNVNGGIGLVATEVGGDVQTVTGDVTIGIDSHVKGQLKVEKPKGSFNFGVNRVPRIIIGPHAVVDGPLIFEREVTLLVHESAKTGPITGATARMFNTDTAPKD
ncbi:hypothetical protein [Pseudoxanthomonas dokdonensis]|uniref:Polymer-forming cytoskeletal protein n=1 Tax=Pseudoxanthomonas dokdonensis TaxID=344882 RepID=A0A0R0CEX5_9GAMM|nr:hypothetical protein [Pseudoxanthomonas dokdonensis]KRG68348.1 hypothetical protein ABB29_13595 [Pseudoxanthomonas dokdonensis]